MAGRLAAVPEETTNGFLLAPYPYPPSNLYRDWIRRVASFGWQIRPTLFSRSRRTHSSSDYSSNSSCRVSTNSGCSSVSAAAAVDFFGGDELIEIAHRMVIDGYTQRMVQEFETSGGGTDVLVLKTWFLELDVDWVLQIREEQLQDKSAPPLQELVEKWIRALTVIVISIKQIVDEKPAVARFGKASIAEMLVFVDTVVHGIKADKLQAVLNMYTCVSGASNYMFMMFVISPEARSILNEMGSSLEIHGNRLIEAISSTMEEVRTLVEDDDSWAIEIVQGGGGIHGNTQLMVDYIVSMRKTLVSTQNSGTRHNTVTLCGLIDDTIDYLKDLLLRKSELCSDPSLRYLFLLNNSYFVTQSLLSSDLTKLWCGLTPECKEYMDNYLDASWGHVMSIIPVYPRPLHCWNKNNTFSLARFESAFHKTYRAQKFWKVPNPQLRYSLRKLIIQRVVSCYRRDYLKEHPEPEKNTSRGNSSPEYLEKMLGELFEG